MKGKNTNSSGPVVVNLQPSPYSEIDAYTLQFIGVVEKGKDDCHEVSEKHRQFRKASDRPSPSGEDDR